MPEKKVEWKDFISDLCYDLVGKDYDRIGAALKLTGNSVYCFTNRNKPQIPNTEQLLIMLTEADPPARIKAMKEICRAFDMAAVMKNGDSVAILRELAKELEQ